MARSEPKVIEQLVKTGKARFKFHHYPAHTGADHAAHAMECAADQSGQAFWQFHDEYMTNSALRASSARRSTAQVAEYAEEIGLDVDLFTQCMDDGTHRDRIRREFQDARRAGVSRTPRIHVNGSNAGITLISITKAVKAASP